MILSVNNVYKSYGKEQVLKGITFKIEEPQIIALVGPNGSGKSTLLNIITNRLPSDKGEVTVLGKSNRDPNIFREISFMQDNTVLYDYLEVVTICSLSETCKNFQNNSHWIRRIGSVSRVT